jgi:hypothetical protein
VQKQQSGHDRSKLAETAPSPKPNQQFATSTVDPEAGSAMPEWEEIPIRIATARSQNCS